MGFNTSILDDRDEILKNNDLENISKFTTLENYFESRSMLPYNLFVVLTTRSLEIDVDLLPKLISVHPKYIGVIGSKKRWIKTTELLLKSGILESEIEQIYSPIGLDLKSETPEEIALAIMAEIMMVKNQASGKNLKYYRRKKVDVE